MLCCVMWHCVLFWCCDVVLLWCDVVCRCGVVLCCVVLRHHRARPPRCRAAATRRIISAPRPSTARTNSASAWCPPLPSAWVPRGRVGPPGGSAPPRSRTSRARSLRRHCVLARGRCTWCWGVGPEQTPHTTVFRWWRARSRYCQRRRRHMLQCRNRPAHTDDDGDRVIKGWCVG